MVRPIEGEDALMTPEQIAFRDELNVLVLNHAEKLNVLDVVAILGRYAGFLLVVPSGVSPAITTRTLFENVKRGSEETMEDLLAAVRTQSLNDAPSAGNA